jgi:hypothetical protein
MKGTREIKGVDVNPRGRDPRRMGHAEIAGGHVETILSGKYADGQDRHGINPDNVHRTAGAQTYADGAAYRAEHRSAPYPK